jgi:hypothetical protein
MPQGGKKTLFRGLIAFLAVMLIAAGVRAEEQGLGAGEMLQPRGLNNVGIYTLREVAPELTGSGVRYAVICRSISYIDCVPQNDYQPNIGHKCFGTVQFKFHDQGNPPPGISPHSTAVCSILFGEDPDMSDPQLGRFYYQGVVPQAQASIYEFQHFLTNNVLYNLSPDADILVAEFGWQFQDWWTRGIESLAENNGLVVVAGIGNGSNACDPPLYPGASANAIGVGVVDSVHTGNIATDLTHFSLAYPEHSSLGPTADGRCKPDIVAPGNCLAAAAIDATSYERTGNWSSYSTPVVAGAVGLLVQKAKQDPALSLALSTQGGNCVMKAILLNSATKLPYWHKGRLEDDDDHVVPLDYVQGAGMLNSLGAYFQLIAGRSEPGGVPMTGWDLNALGKGYRSAQVYKFTIDEPADKIITATIAWNRHYKSVYPFEPMPEKDANLRLSLWALDLTDSRNSYLMDFSDSSVDNIEHIYCRADARYTNYVIIISFSNNGDRSQADLMQRYGLAWNVSQSNNSDNMFWLDLNADGIVNELDFAILLDNWTTGVKSPASYLLGDINSDGRIDVNDLQVFMDHNNRQADWYTGGENKAG